MNTSRVLVVVHPVTYGGLHNMVQKLHGPLLERGFETIAAVPDESEPGVFARMADGGISVHQMPLHRIRRSMSPKVQYDLLRLYRSEVRELARLASDLGADVVQSHGVLNRHAISAARLLGRPTVLQLNSNFAPWVARVSSRRLVRRTSVAMYEGSGVVNAFPVLARRSVNTTIPFLPPVDTQSVIADATRRAAARRKVGIAPDAIVVGTTGNFTRQKGHDRFVRAAANALTSLGNMVFVIIGQSVQSNKDYHQREILSYLERIPGLQEKVHIISPEGPATDLLPALDVYAVTSRGEGVATATLEAMSCSLPIVSFDIGSMRDVVSSLNGFLVADGDVDTMAERWVQLACNFQLRTALGVASRRIATTRTGIDPTADAHAEAYRRALAVGTPGAAESR